MINWLKFAHYSGYSDIWKDCYRTLKMIFKVFGLATIKSILFIVELIEWMNVMKW